MKISFFFIFLNILSFGMVHACEISLCQNLVLFNNKTSLSNKNLIKKTDCSDSKVNEVLQLLNGKSGWINLDPITRYFEDIKVVPNRIRIVSLSEIFQDKYLSPNQRIDSIRTTPIFDSYCTSPDGITFDKNDTSSDNQITGIFKLNNETTSSSFIFSIFNSTQILALVPLTNLSPGQNLQIENFERRIIFVKDPGLFFSPDQSINFFTPTRNISKGAPIENSHFVSKQLVSPSRNTKVVFKSEGLQLNGEGRPQSFGRLGDSINVQVMKKVLTGTVTNINEVTISL